MIGIIERELSWSLHPKPLQVPMGTIFRSAKLLQKSLIKAGEKPFLLSSTIIIDGTTDPSQPLVDRYVFVHSVGRRLPIGSMEFICSVHDENTVFHIYEDLVGDSYHESWCGDVKRVFEM